MKYIESNSTDPYFNLALEEYVFEKLPKDEGYFMLWQNDNTIVIGKYQNAAEEVNQKVVDEKQIKVARRLSGGGAVYHDMGNLNFTFVVDKKDIEGLNFKMFIVPIIETLKNFGVNAEFNGRNDITIDGKKFSGNSQYIRQGRVMHHGCIMLDSNMADVASALNVKAAKFESKNVKSVRSRVTTINANAEKKITMDEFKSALKAHILGDSYVEPYELSEQDIKEIKKLRDEKYATWEWRYGKGAKYEMTREEKFDAGLVSVKMNVIGGKIKDIDISGDFFGNGDIAELENGLIGTMLDESLTDKLKELNMCDYMAGITAEELSELIRG